MKNAALFVLLAVITTVTPGLNPTLPADSADSLPSLEPAVLPKTPVYFIPNRGQQDARASFYARLGRTTLWLTRDGLIFDGREPGRGEATAGSREVTRLTFKGMSPACRLTALEATDHAVSYFNGPEPEDWITGLPTSKAVLYEDVYDKIDLKIYGAGEGVEYDWIVRPGGDPAMIRMAFAGEGRTRIDSGGDIVVETPRGAVRHRKPSAYQGASGRRIVVEADFREIAAGEYGIEVGFFDRTRSLFIDPFVVGYATYLGGRDTDWHWCMAVSPGGEAFLAGQTHSLDFPVPGPRAVTSLSRWDAFIVKMAADGQSLLYSAFFPMVDGGAPIGLAVDQKGAATVVGYTYNNRFPVKKAFQAKFGGGVFDGFIARLTPNGRGLDFSTYFGGSSADSVSAIVQDRDGSFVVAGTTESKNFPLFQPLQAKHSGNSDGFVARFTPDGQELVFSTYLGGRRADGASSLALDGTGAVYVLGWTASGDFPVKNAYQKRTGGEYDVFFAKLPPDGRRIVFSSYLGGSRVDYAAGMVLDDTGAIIIGGYTDGEFPLHRAIRTERKSFDGFVTKLNPDGRSLVYSTYFGGTGHDQIMSVAVDGLNQVWLGGFTMSADFPRKDALQKRRNGAQDGFLSALSENGQKIVFSTFWGGSYWDAIEGLVIGSDSVIYAAGDTNSLNFPTFRPFQKSFKGGLADCFLVRLNPKTKAKSR
ncbi:MAG: hypothetical protein JW742_08020 [Candidatus Aminicenantes bacterium]|nr:hypothetical protein [Candidatus Aminicenantes bacterium]